MRYRSFATLSEVDNFLQVDKRGKSENSLKNLKSTYTGLATRSSMRNLQRCTDIFFMGRRKSHGLNPVTKKSGYFQAAFITLSIPDLHTVVDAQYGYNKLLKKFMQRIIYNFGVRDYIWKFEWQERMQGHWHIFVDRFCKMDEIKRYWIQYLDEEGLTKDFRAKYNYDPSQSCHIKGMRSEGELKYYLNNYITKKSQNEESTLGHLWGASANIKKSVLPMLPITLAFLDNVEAGINRKELACKDIEIPVIGEHGIPERLPNGEAKTFWVCSILRGLKRPVIDYLCPVQRETYNKFILAYRQGDWKATRELCFDLNDLKAHHERWEGERAGGYYWIQEARKRNKEASDRNATPAGEVSAGVSPPA